MKKNNLFVFQDNKNDGYVCYVSKYRIEIFEYDNCFWAVEVCGEMAHDDLYFFGYFASLEKAKREGINEVKILLKSDYKKLQIELNEIKKYIKGNT